MKTAKPRQHLGFDELDDFERIREVFANAGYTDSQIVDFFGGKVPLAPIAAEIPSFVLRSNGGTPLETLIRLF